MTFPLLIDIGRSEDRIFDLISTVGTTVNWAKEKFPGTLDQLGQTIRYKTIVVSFQGISLNKPTNTFSGAHQMMGVATFLIRLVNTDLRTHQDVYSVAREVAEALKGRRVLVFPEDIPHRVGFAWISAFTFNQIDIPHKQCYSYEISLSSEYAAAYKTVKEHPP